MVARLEQLSPFQFFFTLSCADKRWMESIVAILKLNGEKISWKSKNISDVFVNDVPLSEYLENESVNLHDLIKNNILTLTRSFDKRVHAFLKHIVLTPHNEMSVEYYNYRVEFQLRGAGHIHGVL
jgi:hypothetical protein